ncbi:phenoloxidase-activating factor 3-like [Homalodisca vitripennis]|uniref:phenoloxidase-activating factor 3-like n=1 Tax=Homalodisca vitripennis TaxID=197043 RepID=UPI001EEB4C6B|nr:phenoloxidase-activating factor 3-like [Homalodisca vitripennis]
MMSIWVSVALAAHFICANAYYTKEFPITDSNSKLLDWFERASKQGPSEGTKTVKTLDGGKSSNSTTEDPSKLYEDIRNDVESHENWYLLNHGDKCGYSSGNIPKIIGGHNADMGKYPWMVRLIYRSMRKDSEKGLCGGSIINNRYILTAAHCCYDDRDPKLVIARVGEYDVHHTKDCFRGKCAPTIQDVGIESITNHYKFDKNALFNDICLIRTSEEIEFI